MVDFEDHVHDVVAAGESELLEIVGGRVEQVGDGGGRVELRTGVFYGVSGWLFAVLGLRGVKRHRGDDVH